MGFFFLAYSYSLCSESLHIGVDEKTKKSHVIELTPQKKKIKITSQSILSFEKYNSPAQQIIYKPI